jgi:hypothetical protein
VRLDEPPRVPNDPFDQVCVTGDRILDVAIERRGVFSERKVFEWRVHFVTSE